MKDLKHLIYFESLLDNADNELVEQAKKDGKYIMGYTCYHIPEVLLIRGKIPHLVTADVGAVLIDIKRRNRIRRRRMAFIYDALT